MTEERWFDAELSGCRLGDGRLDRPSSPVGRANGSRVRREHPAGLVILAFCWSHVRRGFYRVRGRPAAAGAVMPGMDRGDRRDLPAERRAAEALRPRPRAPDAGVRRGADRAEGSARRPVRAGRARARRPVGRGPRGQGTAFAREPSRGAVRVRRPAVRPARQQCRRKDPEGAGDRPRSLARLRQPGRRQVHGDPVLRRGHALDEPHRRAALAGGVADGVRGERRQAARRPVAVAAMVDERAAPARVHGAGMTGPVECRYYGRDFTAEEMALLRALIAADPQPTRAALSREFCRRVGWRKPDGGLKDMMARVAMLAMHRDGVISLPPPRGQRNPPPPDRLRTRHRTAAVPGPDRPRRGPPAGDAPRRARDPRGQAVERVRRPLPLSRIQDPGRRPDALRRPRPQRLAARHARLLHRRLEARPARQLHRMDPRDARERTCRSWSTTRAS